MRHQNLTNLASHRLHCLEAIISAESDSSVGQALEAQKRPFVNAILLNFWFSNIDGFQTNIELFVYIVSYAGV